MDFSFTLFRHNLATLNESVESLSDSVMMPAEKSFSMFSESQSELIPNIDDHQLMDLSMSMDLELLPLASSSEAENDAFLLKRQDDASSSNTDNQSTAVLTSKRRNKSNLDDIEDGVPLTGNRKRIRKMLFESVPDDKIQTKTSGDNGADSSLRQRLPSDHRAQTVHWRKHASWPVNATQCTVAPVFYKCQSAAELGFAARQVNEDHNLIGDFSRTFSLPVVTGKHPDLKAISHETMADVLIGRYPEVQNNCIIVDCRYPYEFEAGHIVSAKNIYTKDEIVNEFLQSSTPFRPQQQPILIFHCEFSSERGPKLLRFLRNLDRDAHRENYPKLFYPEIYILEGGFKEFYESHKDLCNPDCYKPMSHKDHTSELAFYRSQSKLYKPKESHTLGGKRNSKFRVLNQILG